jgi:hypothetical protein
MADTIPSWTAGVYSRVVVQVKNSNQPLDIARVAYGLGHPAMFRYLVFAEWSYYSFNKSLESGLGHSIELKKDRFATNCFLVPKADNENFADERDAETKGYELILKHLKAQNFPLAANGREQEVR